MAADLPAKLNQKLKQTLAQWRQWQTPIPLPGPAELVTPLSGGSINSSFLVQTSDTRQFVVRVNADRNTIASHNPLLEWRALNLASEAGLGPTPRYFNLDLGTLVCDYLPPDSKQHTLPADVGQLLRKIHALPAVHTRLQLKEQLARYEHLALKQAGQLPQLIQQTQQPVHKLLTALAGKREPWVLCHNDLLFANRLYCNEVLYALDWEYCAMGVCWFDLAVVAAGDELDEHARCELLKHYFAIECVSEAQQQRLADYMLVYRYLELLWYYNLEDPQERATQVNQQRLAKLELALSQASVPFEGMGPQ